MISVSEISEQLSSQVESVCRNLLPNGRPVGREWVCGSVNGEAGQSLKVCIVGGKNGIWSDFASGESGDLLDLWQAVRNINLADAIKEAKTFLGITEDYKRKLPPKKKYIRPEKPKDIIPLNKHQASLDHLMGRGITEDVIALYKVVAKEGSIVFPYIKNNELYGLKTTKLERKKGKKQISFTTDSEPTLFGWHTLTGKERNITICEGEIDAMSLCVYGIPALSVPFGGGGGNKQQWIDTDFNDLEQFDIIYLCLDNDEEGIIGAAEIASRLGQHRCRFVDLPKKDANDCLVADVPEDYLHACFEEAESKDPEELKPAGDYLADIIESFYPSKGQRPGFNLPWEKTKKIRIHHGEMSLWTGYNGHGKSVLLGQVMAEAVKYDERVCIASFEMQPGNTLARMAKQHSGDSLPTVDEIKEAVEDWHDNIWIFNLIGTGKVDRLIDVFEYAFRRYGVRQFVIDSLMKLGIAEDDYNGQKGVVDRLTDFCNVNNVSVHLVAHARKGQNEDKPPKKMDIKGTGAITDLADNVFCVFRNKPKENEIQKYYEKNGYDSVGAIRDAIELKYDAILSCEKCRDNGENEGQWGLYFNRSNLIYSQER